MSGRENFVLLLRGRQGNEEPQKKFIVPATGLDSVAAHASEPMLES